MRKIQVIIIVFIVFLHRGCEQDAIKDPAGIEVNMPADSLVFAVIGDYGLDGEKEAAVADLVKSWKGDVEWI